MKHLDTGSLRKKLIASIIISMTAIFAVLIIITAWIQQVRQNELTSEFLTQVHKSIEHTVGHYVQDYTYRARRFVETTGLPELLKKRDRDAIWQLLGPKWAMMKEEERALYTMHIHLADGTSFLRFHEPEMHGDLIADKRPMIKAMHQRQTMMYGYETGLHATVYRILVPIFDAQQTYLGILEMGLDPVFLLQAIRDITGYDGFVFIKESQLELYSRPGDLMIDGYRLQSALQRKHMPFLDHLQSFGKLEDNIVFTINDDHFLAHTVDMKDYRGDTQVKLVFFQNLESLGFYRHQLVATIGGMILLSLLLLIGYITRRIKIYEGEITRLYEEQNRLINESESRFRLLYDHSPDMYVSVSPADASVLLCNQTLLDRLGYTKEEVIGQPVFNLYAPECMDEVHQAFETFVETGQVKDKELILRAKDGAMVDVSLNVNAVLDEQGKILYSMSSWRDVTERKRDQRALHHSRRKLELVFDTTPEIMFLSNGEEIIKANHALLEFFGFDSLEAFHHEHQCICEYFADEPGALQTMMGEQQWLAYVLAHPETSHKAVIVKDGERFIFHVNASTYDLEDQAYSVVILNDITEINTLKERFEFAINGANDGLWDWDLAAGTVYFTDVWKAQLGYRPEEIGNGLNEWSDRVHPDDMDQAVADIKKSQAAPGTSYTNIHRMRHKDGHWVWILDRGQTLFDNEGSPYRMIGYHTDITPLKELEQQLLQSQQQFESFMENLPAYVTMKDEHDTVIYANSKTAKFLGRDSIVGLKADDLLEPVYADKLHAINKKAREEQYAEAVVTYQDNDGVLRYFRIMTFLIQKMDKAYTGSLYIDITDQYEGQREVRKLQTVLDEAPVSIVITDPEGTIEYVNPFFCRLTGYDADEAIGENPRILKSGHTTPVEYEKLWQLISSGKVWSGSFKNLRKDGSEYWERAFIAPILDEKQQIVNYLGIKQEVSEEMRLRDELAEQEDLMIAQSRHAAMGEMIGMIAHQWRQPIAVIAMGANSIIADIDLDEGSDEAFRQQAGSILKQTEYLSKTIDDFRNFFRPNKEKELVDIAEIIDEAMAIIGKSLEHAEIATTIETEDVTPLRTYSREVLQVVINIIKNAKEALIEHRRTERAIHITLTQRTNTVHLKICDNGGGIKKEVMPRIFDPYFSTKDSKTGTGLGLYMSKTIVDKHLHGSINVENVDGGACFHIYIPELS
jgi:PAS domain S-box-containing protein